MCEVCEPPCGAQILDQRGELLALRWGHSLSEIWERQLRVQALATRIRRNSRRHSRQDARVAEPWRQLQGLGLQSLGLQSLGLQLQGLGLQG